MPSTWPTSPVFDPDERVATAETALTVTRTDAARAARVWAERVEACERDVADARRQLADA